MWHMFGALSTKLCIGHIEFHGNFPAMAITANSAVCRQHNPKNVNGRATIVAADVPTTIFLSTLEDVYHFNQYLPERRCWLRAIPHQRDSSLSDCSHMREFLTKYKQKSIQNDICLHAIDLTNAGRHLAVILGRHMEVVAILLYVFQIWWK